MTRLTPLILCIFTCATCAILLPSQKPVFREIEIICDGITKEIRCDKPDTLKVVNVTYGREVVEFCKDEHDHTPKQASWKLHCLTDVTSSVKKLCDGQRQCEITAKPEDFKTACRQTFYPENYLAVLYMCEKH